MNAHSLRRLVSIIALLLAAITAVSIPLGYLAVGANNAANLLEVKAGLSANRVARYVSARDTDWRHQIGPLSALLEKNDSDENIRVVDSSGRTVLEEGANLAGPILMRGAPITVAGSAVGRVEIEMSLRAILRHTAIVAFFSLLLGLAVFFAVWIFPLKVLDSTLGTLESTNDRFDAALSNMAQGLCMFDADLRLVACNQRYLDLFKLPAHAAQPGASLREMITYSVSAGRHPGQTVDELMENRLAIINERKAATIRSKVDGLHTIEIVYRPMSGGGWVATYDDVTERERQEEALAQQNRRFDAALSNMAQGLCMFDGELRLVACNQHYLDLFKLPAHIAQPGASLRDLIAYSVSEGRHPGETVDELMEQRLVVINKREAKTFRTKVAGQLAIQISYRPMSGGGWVATYDDITERERAEEALAEQNRRFDAALNNMPHGLCMFDGQRRLIVCNRQFVEMYRLPESLVQPGTTLDQIVDYRVATGQGPLDLEGFRRDQETRARDGKKSNYKLCLQDARTIQINYEPMAGGGWVTTHQDVTDRERAEEATAEQNRRLDAALTNMPQGLVMFDSSNRIVVCNDRYIEMYGLSRDIVKPGCTLRELLGQLVADGHIAADIDDYHSAVLADVSRDKTVKTQKTADGREVLITKMRMLGGGWVATHDDITERQAAQAKISHMALHDALTGLPNRLYFSEQLEHRFIHKDRDEKFAVLCFDLDRFKSVNDTLGHSFGDKLLCQVGERIRHCLRDGDTLARLGGDEFAVLQGSVKNLTEINALASRLIEVVGSPFDLDGHQVVIGVSIGIAVAPADAAEPDELLKNADMALYRAKADGRGTFRFFESEMDARMQKRRALELDLRKALINAEFELYYQPIVKLEGDEICGFEALLRWNHPERGIVPPLEFIALAEETELIIPIGEWVLRQACKEAATWPSSIGIAVNISSVQFKMRNLSQMVISALASSGLSARRLELEITESVLLFNNESTLETLHQLRSLGVRISMDDFGTGYSSLSYLRSFPFDKIKIDRSFIHDVTSTQDSMAIVRAVTGLGNSLGMTITGEGVETEDELEYLRKEGCTEAQGYFFSQPKPASEIHKMLAKQMRAAKAVA